MKKILKFIWNLFWLICCMVVVIIDLQDIINGTSLTVLRWLTFIVCFILAIDSFIKLKSIITGDKRRSLNDPVEVIKYKNFVIQILHADPDECNGRFIWEIWSLDNENLDGCRTMDGFERGIAIDQAKKRIDDKDWRRLFNYANVGKTCSECQQVINIDGECKCT